MSVQFRVFRGGPLTIWEDIFRDAADFASSLGRDRIISISHSAEPGRAAVTVWYWSDGRASARDSKPPAS